MLTETPVSTILEVRAATPADASLIHRMTKEAYAEFAASDAPSSVAQECAEDLMNGLTSGVMRALIVEAESLPIGSVRWHLEGDELYFFRLGVLPSARGRGAARALVAELAEIGSRLACDRLRCRVRMNVERNVALYRSMGFMSVGEIEAVRRGGTDVPTGTMEKKL